MQCRNRERTLELEDTMKMQVKETLARRRTVFVLTLAAIVGVCAFTFSGTQNYAWAEGEGPIATWSSVPAPEDGGVPATAGKNLTLEIKKLARAITWRPISRITAEIQFLHLSLS